MNRPQLVSLAVVALLGAPLGCSSDSPKNEDQTEEQVRAEQTEQRQNEREAPGEANERESGEEQTAGEPELPEYEIFDQTRTEMPEEAEAEVKVVMDVRLQSRLEGRDQVEALGKHLKKQQAPEAGLVKINFYLPDQDPRRDGAYAAAEWIPWQNPTFGAFLMGKTRETYLEHKRAREEANAKRDVLGQWSGVNDDERLIIYRRDGSHFLEERSEGEAVRTTELNLEQEGSEKILRPVDDHSRCGHFAITSDGELRCHFKERGARPKRKLKADKKGVKYRSFSPIDE